MRAFMRQEIGFFDSESNSAAELTGFLSEKVPLSMLALHAFACK
tara:strand:+ start:345 stop:476 length:132 start_codon:yes stop_codon:yes gene_type:complete